jgi:hypothetical protein
MRQLDRIALERKRLERYIAWQSQMLALEYRNAVLPAALAEFDKRVSAGEPFELELPTAEEFLRQAVKELESG